MNPMVRRVAAAQAAVDRFLNKRFRWSTNDCARLAGFTLRKLGYAVELPTPRAYRDQASAMAVLKAMGFDDLAGPLDALGLPRIPFAAALPGDVVGVPDETGWVALWVMIGNGRALGYHADSPTACVIQPTFPSALAWRCDPRG